MKEIIIIREYKKQAVQNFQLNDYYKTFSSANVFMYAKSNNITFSKKTAGLSVKCAFNGREIYETSIGKHAIDDTSYLILNKGQEYSGYIKSDTKVESFSLFFEDEFVNSVLGSLITPLDKLLDLYQLNTKIRPVEFFEKSYEHDKLISPILFNLRNHIKKNEVDMLFIEEQFYLLLEKLFQVHKKVTMEIESLPFEKYSTKLELYKRLYRAKDMIDVLFNTDLTLNKISREACLCTHHFIRLFKKLFAITPHQYITRKRLEFSLFSLMKTDLTLSEISLSIGLRNISSFTRLFKNHYLITPTEFRLSNNRKKSILVKQ